MPELAHCPCCPATAHPDGYSMDKAVPGVDPADEQFDASKHLALGYPEKILKLDEDFKYCSKFANEQLPTNYGCCSTFKILSERGTKVVDQVLNGIEKYATSCPRIPKVLRGGTFRNQFLNGLGHSQDIIKLVSQLANCELIYHPMKIQQLHVNMKPKDNTSSVSTKKNIDRWHVDTTPFVLILFCTDPAKYDGGETQYFLGTKDEGTSFLRGPAGALPADLVKNVGYQGKGYGIFAQGSRVFHQVTPVLRGDERTTMVFSFQPRNILALEACAHLSLTYNEVDPLHIFLPDWARYRAWKVMCRFDLWLNSNSAAIVTSPVSETVVVDDIDNPKDKRQRTEHAPEYSKQLSLAVKSCNQKLKSIVETLKYTSNRQYLSTVLADSISELKLFLVNDDAVRAAFPNESDYDMGIKGAVTEVNKCFINDLANLRGAVVDIDNCIEDILTLKQGGSTMEFF